MNELQQIKTKILSLSNSIRSYIGKGLRINTARFEDFLYNNDPEIVEYANLIKKTLLNLKTELPNQYASCVKDVSNFVEILYHINKAYKVASAIQQQINYGYKVKEVLHNAIIAPIKELGGQIDKLREKYENEKKEQQSKTQCPEHLKLYNMFNRPIQCFGQVQDNIEKSNFEEKSKNRMLNDLHTILENNNPNIEKCDYVLEQLNTYKNALQGLKKYAYSLISEVSGKVEGLRNKKNKVWYSSKGAGVNKYNYFETANIFIDGLNEISASVIVASCFSKCDFDVFMKDKDTGEKIVKNKIDTSSLGFYKAYLRSWLYALRGYLNMSMKG